MSMILFVIIVNILIILQFSMDFLIHSVVGEHLNNFQLRAFIKRTAVNICLGIIPKGVDVMGIFIFSKY